MTPSGASTGLRAKGGRSPAMGLAVLLAAILAGCGFAGPTLPDPSTPVSAPATVGPVATVAPSAGTTLRVPADAFEPIGPRPDAPPAFVVSAVSFADADHGWVAGSTGGDGAFALETLVGGRTWESTQVGVYVAPAIALGSDDSVWVSTACVEDEPGGCVPALQRRDPDGTWRAVADVAPVGIDFAGATGAIAVVLPNGRRRPDGTRVPVLQVSTDGGATWQPPANPCGIGELRGITTPREGEVVVGCGGTTAPDGTASLDNILLRSSDAGLTWRDVRAPGAGNVLPGSKVGLDIADDGTGLWWGAFTPAMATSDDAQTWTALDVADGDRRIAGSGASIRGGAGYLGVVERLVWIADGEHWEDRALFPGGPCCGG